jgi:hypothetical protein
VRGRHALAPAAHPTLHDYLLGAHDHVKKRAAGDRAALTRPVTPVARSTAPIDPIDWVVGRAYVETGFMSMLLSWPQSALEDDDSVPSALVERLNAIRAEDLKELAEIALRGYTRSVASAAEDC